MRRFNPNVPTGDWPFLNRVLGLLFNRTLPGVSEGLIDHPHQDVKTTASPIFAGIKVDNLQGILKATNGQISGDALTYDTDYKCLKTDV